MQRFILGSLIACLLGLAPLPLLGSEAWAQRSRASRSSSKSKKPSPSSSSKSVPKFESKTDTSPAMTDPVTGESATAGAAPPSRGPARIDFDDRLIQGQTNKSGAVYLYDRKELKTRSMIRERESFRSETLSTVYDE